jgi:hypothetical protein
MKQTMEAISVSNGDANGEDASKAGIFWYLNTPKANKLMLC